MKRSRHVLAAAAVSVALMLTGCSGGGSSSGSSGAAITIGFITKFPGDFYDSMVNAVKSWNKDHSNVKVLFGQGSNGTDDDGEIAAIKSMVAGGVKAIAITPTSKNVQPELQIAVDKGIKVVLIDNDIPDWTGKSSVVATDNVAGGMLAGAWLKSKLQPGAKIAILQGVLGNPSLDARVTGMLAALGPSATVVSKTPTDCDQTKGLNATQDIVTANPDVNAIYGACGPPILGALEAIRAAGKSGIVVVGFDAVPGEIVAIKAGTEAASVAQFPEKMGSLGAQTAVDAAMGKPVQAKIDTGTEIVTMANAKKFS